MSGRVVLGPDVLLAAVGGASEGDGVAARRALRGWIEDGTELLLAGAALPALLDALRSRGWPAARIAEALHALDGLDLQTVEVDLPALLLAADAMGRHGLAAPTAAALVLADLDGALIASLDPRVVDVAAHGILVGGAAEAAPGQIGSRGGVPPGPHALPDYRGLGALLGDLRRAATESRR
jgi:hypothetical protein